MPNRSLLSRVPTGAFFALGLVLAAVAVLATISLTGDTSAGMGTSTSFAPIPEPPTTTPLSPAPKPNALPPGRGTLVAQIEKTTQLRLLPGGQVVGRITRHTEFGSPKILAVVGHQGDWVKVITPERGNGHRAWIPKSSVVLGRTRYELDVSVGKRLIVVRKDGKKLYSFHVAVGRPTSPTPLGDFAVTDKLRVNDPGSPYGCCAVATSARQKSVPQGWGGGDRIAIHATQDQASIGTAASLGCLRAPTPPMKRLVSTIPLGSPVHIRA